MSEISFAGTDRVFKAAPWVYQAFCFLLWALGIAGIIVGIIGGIPRSGGFHGIPVSLGYWIGGAFCLFGLFCLGTLRAGFKPTNWLFRCDADGIIIKYRSYLNWRLPEDDLQAVRFDYCEIAWIKKTKQRITSSESRGRKRVEYSTFLDIGLKDHDTSELERHLETERQRKRNWLYLDYPVSVLSGGVVRIRWRGIIDYFRPGPGEVITWLSQFVQVASTETDKVDFTCDRKAPVQDEDTKILSLARSGDKMAAIKLARELYGCSLTEAVEFVEKLQSEK